MTITTFIEALEVKGITNFETDGKIIKVPINEVEILRIGFNDAKEFTDYLIEQAEINNMESDHGSPEELCLRERR